MRQTCRTPKAIQVLGDADRWVLDMFNRLFDDSRNRLSFILAGAYLPLVINPGVGKRKEITITESIQTPYTPEIPLFFHVAYFPN